MMAVLVYRATELAGHITQFVSELDATTHAGLINALTGACDALTRLAATTNDEVATTNDERPAQNSGRKRKRLSDASQYVTPYVTECPEDDNPQPLPSKTIHVSASSTHDPSPEATRQKPQPEAGYEVHRSSHSFTIEKEEMGENLVASLEKVALQPGYHGLSRVADLPTINWPDLFATVAQVEHDLLSVRFATHKTPGRVHLYRGESKAFEAPNFADRAVPPSDDDVRAYLDEIFTSIPVEEVPYYVGPLLFDSHVDDMLFPGRALLPPHFPDVPGVNSTYMHAGNRNSGTAFHCEDGTMRSVNLTLLGWNIWILVAVHHTSKLESFLLDKSRPRTSCDQSIRHENIILSPNVLQTAGIDFVVLLAGPSDLVETQPRQYHWVINYSTVVKMANNFLRPGERALPDSISLCDQCGLAPVQPHFDQITLVQTKRNNTRQRTQVTETMPPSKPTTRTSSASQHSKEHAPLSKGTKPKPRPKPKEANSAEQKIRPDESASQETWAAYINGKAMLYTRIEHTFEKAEAFHLVQALNSDLAVHSLTAVVRGWRARSSAIISHHATLSQTIQAIVNFESKAIYSEVIRGLLLVDFSIKVNELAHGRTRLQDVDWKRVQDSCPVASGMPIRKLRQWRELGQKLDRYPAGILCAITGLSAAPFHLSLQSLAGLTEVKLLTSILASGEGIPSRILELGDYVVESFRQGRDLDEFGWESPDAPGLDQLSEAEVLKWLHRFPIVQECYYEPGRFDKQEKPENWPGKWPADPMTGEAFEQQCCYCSSASCTCIELVRPSHTAHDRPCSSCLPETCGCDHQHLRGGHYLLRSLTVRDCERKGQGLFVVGQPGHTIFHKDDVLGELTGELVPPGTFSTNWGAEMATDIVKHDIKPAVCVAQLRYAEAGNRLRKVNHCCHLPPARFSGAMVSERFRILLLANKDLYEGEEVTVTYQEGKPSFDCFCAQCQPNR
ncbi:uncharacterized protein B0I36DRAFT_334631 [Microdochium trichocladiopsis]|uniref:JmjC domain-containing protein n=1 Tax=Microdochium trichocladiopsis TaxID=1682393 RepID=A0A9P8XX51_9PEZI|nr:uncharacterized protein B0I36DRAFT_334631 [Microdochium trichocladiopsis]KAH7021531.1 hypothetical protein B0I36DRAFT_334631 [Microdochium trichocladiopsis]